VLDCSGFVALAATDDPDLHLIADGVRFEPHVIENRRNGHQRIYRFRLDCTPDDLVIASRATVPKRIGLNHDPRTLGVAVRSITLRGPEGAFDLPL
jgi:hypothetical protein